MKKLFTEFNIKNVKMKNRICVPPMVIEFTKDGGYVASENVERYKKLAQGGVGLIIQEATCINADGRLSEKQIGIWNDDQIE